MQFFLTTIFPPYKSNEEFVTFFWNSEKLVTIFSLRLELYFRGVGDCIGLRPILWRCKVRNRWNLAGFAP